MPAMLAFLAMSPATHMSRMLLESSRARTVGRARVRLGGVGPDSDSWDGQIDEEAHLGLDDDGELDEEEKQAANWKFVPAAVAPDGFDMNDDNMDELTDWAVDDEWGDSDDSENEPSVAPDGVPAPPLRAFIADWGVDEEAHLGFDDDDDFDDE